MEGTNTTQNEVNEVKNENTTSQMIYVVSTDAYTIVVVMVILWASQNSATWEARNMRTEREKRGGGRVLMIENG